MIPIDLLTTAIAFILGIIAAYLFFRQQIGAIEEMSKTIPNAGSSYTVVLSMKKKCH
jgi:amino acid transporter